MSHQATNKLSFTIRRPSPVSRSSSTGADSNFKVPALPRHLSGASSGASSPLTRGSPKPNSRTYDERDSSDEDEKLEDELVTGFDEFGVQRVHEKKKPQGPLVIPPLRNRDWREQARKRRSLFVPSNAVPATGADGSVGGLGKRDSINSGPQLTGLQVKKRTKMEEGVDHMLLEEETEVKEETQVVTETTLPAQPKEEDSEEKRAIRALLADAQGQDGESVPHIDVIPVVTEDDAYRQDVVELPDSATLQDYERVPVSEFGAALLRGMGWKDGMGASKTGKGPVQPYLPQARPALLGIGAKEKELLDDGSKRKKGRPDKQRYVPLIKKGRSEGSESASPSGSSSRRRTPSPGRRRDHDRYDSDFDRHRERDGRRDRSSDRTDRDRDRDRDRRHEKREYRDRYSTSTSRRDLERDSERHRDRLSDGSQSRRDRDSRGR